MARKGEENVNWKGDEVSYISLHQWVRTNKDIPSSCEGCGAREKLDAHNKDGKYTRDLNKWEYLCRKCHMRTDGRLMMLSSYNKYPPKDELCKYCNTRNQVRKTCGDIKCKKLLRNERRRNATR